MKRIYITYCWQNEKIADILDHHFQQVGIKLIRDKRDLDYSSSIENFARKMRQGSYNICIISNEYLKRINCMYEINQLLKDDNFAKKKFCPIVVDTSSELIDLTPNGIENYAQFWKDELQKQDQLINSISENRNKGEQIKQLKKIEAIYNDIREFLYLLKDVKYINTSDIEKKGMIVIGQSIFKKIGINPKVNLEELYNITLLDDIEEAETKLAQYANDHLLKDNEYYLFTKATIYEKFHHYDLALYNYCLAYKVQKNFILAYEAIITLYLRDIYKIDERFKNTVYLLKKIDGENETLQIAEALIHLQNGKNKKAIDIFEKIIEQNSSGAHREYIYNNLANAYERMYENEPSNNYLLLAERNYKLSIEENPSYYQALNNLALLYLMKLSDLPKAQKAISDCLAIFPEYHMGLNTQGLIYEEKHDFEKALEYYMKSYEYSKSYSPPINQIGRILDFEYNNSLCKLYYLLAYEINPKSMVNCFNLGNYYRKYTNNTERAEELLTYALSVQYNNILCNMAMGLLKYQLEDFISARKYFSFALAYNPDYICACFCLVVSEIKIGTDYIKITEFLNRFMEDRSCSYIDQLISALKGSNENLDAYINRTLQEYIEYEYVNISGQISKTLIINPVVNINDAYQYIVDNFYALNSYFPEEM